MKDEDILGKVVDDHGMLSFNCNFYRAIGCGRIVLTTGAFDVLHEGHFGYLNYARNMGDALVVGINDDDFVRNIKGADRPYHPHKKRALQVAELDCVDMVHIFTLQQQIEIIHLVRPFMFVMSESSHRKPSDRQHQIDAVKMNGGKIVILPAFSDVHSTDIIKKMRE